ncbi:DUF6119 family protein [Clavibacter michiganensis]|uniref:DUF6119 family protein n=1 Tax=Clavibacter michiganensis TaxID=28447 RepID=UPI00345B5E86
MRQEDSLAAARSFSIFLLKPQYSKPKQALKEEHKLQKARTAPGGASPAAVYISQSTQSTPWWKTYFSVEDNLRQGFAGAIAFIKTSNRTFALTFGHTRHNLRDESYEYDFGLRTTLNSVDPHAIRNTDELNPATSRRRRTQLPERSDLTYFDFDGDSAVLRSLTGAIRPEYNDLFNYATGASNLRISSKKSLNELKPMLDRIYAIYNEDTFKSAFPSVYNIQPMQDPATLVLLNSELETAIRNGSDALTLTIPELMDFQEDYEVAFSGLGVSKLYQEASLGDYFEYLSGHEKALTEITIEDLRAHRLQTLNENGVRISEYSIFRCLIFEVTLPGASEAYHLNEGTWYRVDADYLTQLSNDLDPLFSQHSLPARTVHTEYEYNEGQLVPHWTDSVLLDRTDTSPAGQTSVEPCDVARAHEGRLILTHVKLGVAASDLSHLFSQGTTAVELLNSVPAAREKLENLIVNRHSSFDLIPLKERRLSVEYVIVTKKDASLASEALPLFSRINLRRAHQSLVSMQAEVTVYLASDEYVGTPRPKPRQSRTPRVSFSPTPE